MTNRAFLAKHGVLFTELCSKRDNLDKLVYLGVKFKIQTVDKLYNSLTMLLQNEQQCFSSEPNTTYSNATD